VPPLFADLSPAPAAAAALALLVFSFYTQTN
jgi:hypothetical protein